MQRIPTGQCRRLLSAAVFVTITSFCGTLAANAADNESDFIGYMGVGGTANEVAHVLGFINPDGSQERYPDFGQPGQKSWVFGPQFSDRRRIFLTSLEDTNLQKVRSGLVLSRDWIYNIESGKLEPALLKDRQADLLRPYALLPGDSRIIETAIINHEERIYVKDLDGGNAIELTKAGGGFHYALELSHDGKRLACHVTGGKPDFYNPGMYSINVFNLADGKRTFVAGEPDHLMFGPHWSPDDRWLVYLDCHAAKDTAHFRAALAVGKSDGGEHRVITPGQTHWFGTPFGSNMSEWSPDGKTVTYTRLQENSKADMSEGGSQLCLLNPTTGDVTELTPAIDGVWDYRAAWRPDGGKILFTRVRNGAAREMWIMDPDGSNQKRLTDGYQHKGADFGRWLRAAK
ncbi:MAG: hypothetical protein AB7O26_13190 [Planctomycetaceae bacterium]